MAYGTNYRPEMVIPLRRNGDNFIMCMGGPWDGKVLKDIYGDMLKVPNTNYQPDRTHEEYVRLTIPISRLHPSGEESSAATDVMVWSDMPAPEIIPSLIQSHLRRALSEGRQTLPPEIRS